MNIETVMETQKPLGLESMSCAYTFLKKIDGNILGDQEYGRVVKRKVRPIFDRDMISGFYVIDIEENDDGFMVLYTGEFSKEGIFQSHGPNLLKRQYLKKFPRETRETEDVELYNSDAGENPDYFF